MKRLVAALVVFMALGAHAQAMFQSMNYSTGLVGLWKLNEGTGSTAFDSSGYGNNGTWSGTAGGTSGFYSPGNVGQWSGFFLNNSVGVPANAALNFTGPVTMSAWVYPTTSVAYQGIIAKGPGNTREYAYFLNQAGPTQLYASLGDYPAGNQPGAIGVVPGWTVNAWNFIVVTADGTTVNAYINGVLSYTGSWALASVSVSNPLAIGQDTNGAFPMQSGRINDARVYSRALSAGEIAQMYLAHN